MLEKLRYHWLIRRRAKRMLRDYVEEVPASAEHDVVIDLTDDTHQHAKVPTDS